MSDLKTRILAAKKKLAPVDVEDWDFPVFVRRMTSAEREVYRRESEKPDSDWVQEQRIIVASCLCDENGAAIFASPDELKEIDSAILDKLSGAVSQMSGVTKEAEEEIKKKSMSAENSGSGSSSPVNSTAP